MPSAHLLPVPAATPSLGLPSWMPGWLPWALVAGSVYTALPHAIWWVRHALSPWHLFPPRVKKAAEREPLASAAEQQQQSGQVELL